MVQFIYYFVMIVMIVQNIEFSTLRRQRVADGVMPGLERAAAIRSVGRRRREAPQPPAAVGNREVEGSTNRSPRARPFQGQPQEALRREELGLDAVEG